MNNHSDRVRIILVDDEEEFLQSATRALERRDVAVSTAKNGEEALRMIEHHIFHVAVLDVKMPGIDGVELFRRMKNKIPDLPVIILTGHGSIAQAFETSKEGIYDYITKPCDMDALVLKIKEAAKVRLSKSGRAGTKKEYRTPNIE